MLYSQQFHDLNIGSPYYMAPESYIQNLYGPKSDVWAFGVIIYELLHGRSPFSNSRNDQELKNNMMKGISEKDLCNGLSPELKELLFRCLTVEECNRISVEEIERLPYFQKRMTVLQPPSPRKLFVNRANSMPYISESSRSERLTY